MKLGLKKELKNIYRDEKLFMTQKDKIQSGGKLIKNYEFSKKQQNVVHNEDKQVNKLKLTENNT